MSAEETAPLPLSDLLAGQLARIAQIRRVAPVDDVPPAPFPPNDCTVCHGLRFVSVSVEPGDPRFGRSFPCTACTAQQAENRRARLLRHPHVAALVDRRLETFDGSAHPAAHARALAFAANPSGFFGLFGPVGTGKTHLAAGLFWSFAEGHGLPQWHTASGLLDEIRASFGIAGDEPGNTAVVLARLAWAPLLVVDDLDAHQPTPWATDRLGDLLNTRYENRLPTIITSNKPLGALTLTAPRLASRLRDAAHASLAVFDGPDHRRRTPQAGTQDQTRGLAHDYYRLDNDVLICTTCRVYPCAPDCADGLYPDTPALAASRRGDHLQGENQ